MSDIELLGGDPRIPHLKLGALISFEKGGVLYTDTVTSITRRTGSHPPLPRRTLWQRIVRRLTPRRLRKPIPIPPSEPDIVIVGTGAPGYDEFARHQKRISEIQALIGGFQAAASDTARTDADDTAT